METATILVIFVSSFTFRNYHIFVYTALDQLQKICWSIEEHEIRKIKPIYGLFSNDRGVSEKYGKENYD